MRELKQRRHRDGRQRRREASFLGWTLRGVGDSICTERELLYTPHALLRRRCVVGGHRKRAAGSKKQAATSLIEPLGGGAFELRSDLEIGLSRSKRRINQAVGSSFHSPLSAFIPRPYSLVARSSRAAKEHYFTEHSWRPPVTSLLPEPN